MRIALAVIGCVIATACGRLDFGTLDGTDASAQADAAPIGHDEDGDGIPDLRDPCPALAGDTTDTDGDGVGDACDPNPTVAGDRIVLFSPLTPGDHPFDGIDGWTQEPDAIRWAGLLGGQHITLPLISARVEVGFTIVALVGTTLDQHQIASGIDTTADPYYFTELNQNDQFSVRASTIVRYTTGTYSPVDSISIPAVHEGSGLIRYDARAGATPRWTYDAGWVGEMYSTSGPTPGYVGGQGIRFSFNGLDLELRYVLVISSP